MKRSYENINILIAGDFAPYLSVKDAYMAGKCDFYDPRILGELHNKDLSLVNLELPLTQADAPIPKVGPHFKASPELIKLVKQAGFDIACLANNYIYDQGIQGLKDTLHVCKQNGIATVGAGLNLEQAKQTLYRKVKGRTVAIVNFAENEFCNASLKRGGANPMDLIDNVHQIQDAKKMRKSFWLLCMVDMNNTTTQVQEWLSNTAIILKMEPML